MKSQKKGKEIQKREKEKSSTKEIEISNAKEIIGLRNLIIHAYDAVDYEKLWAIVINHIPKLKIEIEQLIKKYD